MRHILAVLALGATLALSTSAAFAFGSNLDYPGPGLRGSYPDSPGVAPQDAPLTVDPSTDSTVVSPWWIKFRQMNIGH